MVDWDKRYRNGFYRRDAEPHGLLQEFWHLIPGKKVIDIAMGTGRDGKFLAKKGFCVYGLERSAEAVLIAKKASGRTECSISIVQGDAAAMPFKNNSVDCVLVFYFLQRDIMRNIADMLKKGGILIYETFLKRQNKIDRPRNPEYLLEDGELIAFFRDFDLLFYEETISGLSGKRRAAAKFIGRKR
jgi:ubiquinone/menaquinone biosynthesis C-methylase UbiE